MNTSTRLDVHSNNTGRALLPRLPAQSRQRFRFTVCTGVALVFSLLPTSHGGDEVHRKLQRGDLHAERTTQSDESAAPIWPADAKLVPANLGYVGTALWVKLHWNPPEAGFGASEIVAYQIFQNGEAITTEWEGNTGDLWWDWVDGISEGETYTWTVEAQNDAGVWSGDGPSVTLKVEVDVPPKWPDDAELTIGSLDSSSLTLIWPDVEHHLLVYRYEISIYRDDELMISLSVETPDEVRPPETSVTVEGLSAGQSYRFEVEAADYMNQKTGDPLIMETNLCPPDGDPFWQDSPELIAEAVGARELKVSWPPVENEERLGSYRLYVDAEAFPWTTLSRQDGVPPATSIRVWGLCPANVYSFRVEAWNVCGDLTGQSPEYAFATDGFGAGPTMEIERIGGGTGESFEVRLEWETLPGGNYVLQESEDLDHWTKIGTFSASGTGEIHAHEAAISGGRGFFRVVPQGAAAACAGPSRMIRVEGGKIAVRDRFSLFSPLADDDLTDVDSFLIEKHPVTRELFRTVRDWAIGDEPEFSYGIISGVGCTNDHPITQVNLYDAIKWCNARSEMEGLTPVYYTESGDVYRTGVIDLMDLTINASADGYRLPTGAEWKFAASGGNLSEGYTFSGSDSVDDVAWHRGNSQDAECTYPWMGTTEGEGPWPVMKKAPNELGLFDMSGNVHEWVTDTDPEFPDDAFARGGSWFSHWLHARITGVFRCPPTTRNTWVGLRVVRNEP